MKTPILMIEEYWGTSQYSVARYYGGIRINRHEYVIMRKDGKDIFEASVEAERLGKPMAIEPGEPADLLREDFKEFYKELGRDGFIAVLKANQEASAEELKDIMRKEVCHEA